MKCTGSLYLNNKPFTMISDPIDISFEGAEIPKYMSDVRIVNPSEAELTLECEVNTNLLKQLAGIDLTQGNLIQSCSMELRSPSRGRQIRRHKKKRINKKWAKRYGYITEFESVTLRDCTIETHNDGSFDIMGY